MKFKCQTRDLAAGLSIVGRALPARPDVSILESVVLEACPEGLRLTCGDLAMGIETVIDAEVAEEGRVALPGKLLIEAARKLPDSEMVADADEKHRMTIRCARSRYVLPGLDADEYPAPAREEGGEPITIQQGQLRELIQGTAFAASDDQSRPMLTGCLLEADPDGMRMVAIDGYQMALRRLPYAWSGDPMQAVIPAKMLTELAKIAAGKDAEARLCIGRAHLIADLGATRVWIRLLQGEFTRYRRVVPTEWRTELKARRAELKDAVDRAALMTRDTKDFYGTVRLHITEQLLTLAANSEIGGEAHEQVEIEQHGQDLDIAFDARYLINALGAIADEEVCLRFNTHISPCEIRPVKGDAYYYLALPVNLV